MCSIVTASADDRQDAYDALERAALHGHPAPLYVGDGKGAPTFGTPMDLSGWRS